MAANKTVLVVDDNELVLESIELLLAGTEGLHTIRALGAEGALRHLRHAPVDIIIADVILTGSISGIDLCHEAIKRHPDVALVVITADSEVQLHDVPPRGVFLRKPFGATELMVALQMAQRKVSRDSP